MSEKTVLLKKLNDGEIMGINALEKRYNIGKEIFFKLDEQSLVDDGGKAAHVLHYAGEELTAYMALSYCNSGEMECTAVTDDGDTFLKMYNVALDMAKSCMCEKVIFIVDKNHVLIADILKEKGMKLSFSEHRMEFNTAKYAPKIADDIKIKYSHIPDEMSVATKNGKYIGKLRVENVGGVVGIYGFEVGETLRGQGYGRKILNIAIEDVLKTVPKKLYLEVETQNHSALHIYETSGFEIKATFDYYI